MLDLIQQEDGGCLLPQLGFFVVDESMVVFYNKFAPGWIVVSHSMGNEYHTTVCCQSKIIFWVELVKGKDIPKDEHGEM